MVFTTTSGLPLSHTNMIRQFRGLAKQAGLPHIGIYEMRHTAATMMIPSGVPIEVVSKALGHSSIRVTLGIYGHLYEEQKQQVADAMDALLGGPKAVPRK